MKILVVGLVENPQMDRLWEEGYKRGHNIVGCYTSELTVFADNGEFKPSLRGKNINNFDLIYLWVIGKRRWEWILVCKFLYEKYKTIIVNKVNVTKEFNPSVISDLLLLAKEGIAFPKSSVILSEKSIESQISEFTFPAIVKSGTSRQGKDVYKVGSLKELTEIVKKIGEKKDPIVIREFIPNEGDIRVFTVGGKAVSAMRRIPREGEFRSNISLGARGKRFDLEKYPDVKKIAENASNALGLEIAGVDVMIHKETRKPYVLEVNSGPQFLGIEKYTKANIALEIIKYFEGLYAKKEKS